MSEVVSAPGVRVGTAGGKFVVIFAKGDQHFASRRRIPRSEGQATSVSDDQDAAVSVPDDGSETLPISALRTPPRARLPMTIKPAPTSSPRSTISLSGRPLTRCVSATATPSPSTRSACQSRNSWACAMASSSSRSSTSGGMRPSASTGRSPPVIGRCPTLPAELSQVVPQDVEADG